jgi:hypothetical protein
MDWQALITALIVASCALYSTWRLLPVTLRARWSARLLGQPVPAAAAGACGGCDGCGGGSARPLRPPAQSVIRIVRR